MTKIYKSIPTAPDDETKLAYFEEARRLFANFHNTFEAWAYDELLTTRDKDKQTWEERQVATTVWTALATLGYQIFPTQWSSKTDKHESAPWAMERDIDKNITRYQRAFNVAFKAIDDLLATRKNQGKVPLEPVELLHIGPVQVVIHNQGREERNNDGSLDDELGSLTDAIHKIIKAGFPEAVRGLTVHVSFIQTALRAGQYDPSKDELYLFPLGVGRENNQTLVHEIGHRFYFRALPANAREHWKEVIDSRAVIIEDKDIDHMVDKYMAPWIKAHGSTPFRTELLPLIHEESEELAAKCRELSDHVPAFTREPEEIRDFWKKNYKGERVNLEEVTDYGNTNEKEAFAEAFMLYVTQGPRALGPWTRQFFETISRGGGAKLSRVLARFLAAEEESDPVLRKIDALPKLEGRGCASSADCVPAEAVFSKPFVSAIYGFKRSHSKLFVKASVPVKDIYPVQEFLNRDALKAYVKHMPAELPIVVKHTDGRLFAQNHTRIAAQILKGASHATVRLIEYTGKPDEPYKKPE